MAHDPLEHISDSYYFEVPKMLCQYDNLTQIPKWLRDQHPHVTDINEWKAELDGKVLIPQPFGTPKNLFEPGTGFCISKFMVMEVIACLLICGLFIWLANRLRQDLLPKGRLATALESVLVFIRDGVARPALGDHEAEHFLPFLWTLFLFIAFCNLLGLVPWMGTATSSFSTTLALALMVFCITIGMGFYKLGPIGFFMNMVPKAELPIYLQPVKLLILAIETIGLLIKHGVLAIRLLANMISGHLVLLAVLGFIIGASSLLETASDLPAHDGHAAAAAATSLTGEVLADVQAEVKEVEEHPAVSIGNYILWMVIVAISIGGAVCLILLEILVAGLQAYVFTFLTALFIGMGMHDH